MINNIDFKIKNLAEIFKGKVIGNNNLRISGIGTIENAKKGDITFLSNKETVCWYSFSSADCTGLLRCCGPLFSFVFDAVES